MEGKRDPAKVDLKDVDNWLVSRNANGACYVCEENDWLPPSRPLALLTITEEGTFHPREAAIVAVYVCRNCASMRLHAPALLEATQEAP
jgi:hypothetical protein